MTFSLFKVLTVCSTVLKVCSTVLKVCCTVLRVCRTVLTVCRTVLTVCSTVLQLYKRTVFIFLALHSHNPSKQIHDTLVYLCTYNVPTALSTELSVLYSVQ